MASDDADGGWREWARSIVLVEGDSDAAAVTTLATRLGRDLREDGVHVVSAHGITNFMRVLGEVATSSPAAAVAGLYDEAEERYVVRALERIGHEGPLDRDGIAALGFFPCVADLEDELIRALGTDTVEGVLERQGELVSFRRFQAQPAQRGRPLDQQLRRFLGTRATRKIRYGSLLAGVLDPRRLPMPLDQLLDRVQGTAHDPSNG